METRPALCGADDDPPTTPGRRHFSAKMPSLRHPLAATLLWAAAAQSAPAAAGNGGLIMASSGWRHPVCYDDAEPAPGTPLRRTQQADSRVVWTGTTSQDLWDEYGNIFTLGNRNAASHLWATFVLERSWQMSPDTVVELFGSFCPISGSPVQARDSNRYRVTLETSDGTSQRTGFLHYCCWPCLCDTMDFLKVDTKTVETTAGPIEYHVTVLGNPCDTERGDAFLSDEFVSPFDGSTRTLDDVAREVRCADDGSLIGATLSDGGWPIIGFFHDSIETTAGLTEPLSDATPGRVTEDAELGSFNDARDMQPICDERAAGGYASGMGEIFRQVAGVSPLTGNRSSTRPTFRASVPDRTQPDSNGEQRGINRAATSASVVEDSSESGPELQLVGVGALVTLLVAAGALGVSKLCRARETKIVKIADEAVPDEQPDTERRAALEQVV